MNSSISISWGVAAVCLLIFTIIGLTLLKVIAAVLGRIFSRSVAGGLPAQKQLAVPLLVVGLCVGIVAVKSSRVRSQVVADDTVVVVDQSVQETMKNLSDARQQIHDVVNTRMIALLDEETTSEQEGSEQAAPEQASGTAETSATDKQDEPKPQDAADADAAQNPSPASSETKSEPASPPAATASETNSTASTTDETTASETPAVAETPAAYLSAEERAKRAAEVGELIRSLLSHAGAPAKPAVAEPTKAVVEGAESEDGGVMVFTLTPEDASQMFGPEMLSQLKSGLPKEVQAAFALVPLTAPVDSAVTPVKPFLAAGSLQSLADKLVTLLDPITGKSLPNNPNMEATVFTHTAGIVEPAWVRKPDGGRITVESRPVFEGGDIRKALAEAVNEAYKQHAKDHFESLAPAVRNQLNRVQLKLDDQTAKLCIVEEYVRNEQGVFGSAGEKPFQIAYALVQFPEKVDIATDKQLRLSMQNDRLLALGLAIGFAWLGVVSACFGIRTWTRRTGFRRLYTFPLFGVAVTFLLSTIAIVGATTMGDGPHVSSSDSKPIVISVPSV